MFILITYNLKNPESNYSEFFKIIEGYEEHIQVMDNVWIIQTEESVINLSKRLQSLINVKEDTILLLEISPKLSIAGWLPSNVVNWIQNTYFISKDDKEY